MTASTTPLAAPVTPVAPALGFEFISHDEMVYLHATTVAVALTDLLRGRGHTVLVEDMERHGGKHSAAVALVSDPTEPHRYRVVVIDAFQETQWTDVACDEPTRRVVLRRPLLDQSLLMLDGPAACAGAASLMDYVSGEAWAITATIVMAQSDPLIDAARAAALNGWWADRMAEGHTPGRDGSANLILSLALPSDVTRRLGYDLYGTPFLTSDHT